MASVFLFVLAAAGLANAGYLTAKHFSPEKRPLVCPFGQHCEEVLDSKYGRVLGFRNEVIGVIYYSITLILFFLSGQGVSVPIRFPVFEFLSTSSPLVLDFYIAIPATIASVILLGIQAFVLRNWCTYCLFATLVNVLIFLTMSRMLGYL